jgi:hypothetical protein
LIEEKHSVSEYLKHSPEQEAELHIHLNGDPVDYFLWWRGLSEQIQISLYNSFQKGEKGKGQRLCESMDSNGKSAFTDMLDALTEACEREDDLGAREILEDLPDNQKSALIDALDVGLVRFANSIGEAA